MKSIDFFLLSISIIQSWSRSKKKPSTFISSQHYYQWAGTRNLKHKGHSGSLLRLRGDGERCKSHTQAGLASWVPRGKLPWLHMLWQRLKLRTQDMGGKELYFKGSDPLQGFSAPSSLNPWGTCQDSTWSVACHQSYDPIGPNADCTGSALPSTGLSTFTQ